MTSFFAGQEIVADDFDNLINPARVGCRVRRVANQSVAVSTVTPFAWDTEDEDTDGFITVPGTTITIPTGLSGVYAITAKQNMGTSPATSRTFLEINSTSALGGMTTDWRLGSINGNESGRIVIAANLRFDAGDSFVINAFQSTAGAINYTGALHCFRVSI